MIVYYPIQLCSDLDQFLIFLSLITIDDILPSRMIGGNEQLLKAYSKQCEMMHTETYYNTTISQYDCMTSKYTTIRIKDPERWKLFKKRAIDEERDVQDLADDAFRMYLEKWH